MTVVTQIRIDTHAEIFIYDPFPTTVKRRFNNCSREAILEAVTREYGDDLIGVAIYDVNVVQVDGIIYKSNPINTTSWKRNQS